MLTINSLGNVNQVREKWKDEHTKNNERFIRHVERLASRFRVGTIMEVRYRRTRCGQYFAILISKIPFLFDKFKPYRIRIIMDEQHREYMCNKHQSVVYEEFSNYSKAVYYAGEWQTMLENGEYNKIYEEHEKHFNQELSIAKMPVNCAKNPDKYLSPGVILRSGSCEGIYMGYGNVVYVSNHENIRKREVKMEKLVPYFVKNESDAIHVKVFRIQRCSPFEVILAAKHYEEYNLCEALETLCALGYENIDNSVIPKNTINRSTLIQLYRACFYETMALLGYKNYKSHLNYLMQTMKEKICFAAGIFGFIVGILFGCISGLIFEIIFTTAFGIPLTISRLACAFYTTFIAIRGGYFALQQTEKFFKSLLERRKSIVIQNLVLFFIPQKKPHEYKIKAINLEDGKLIEFPMFYNASKIPTTLKERIKAIVYVHDNKRSRKRMKKAKKMLTKVFLCHDVFCSMICFDVIIINQLSPMLKLLQNEVGIIIVIHETFLKMIEVYRDGKNMLRKNVIRKTFITNVDQECIKTKILGNIANPKYIIAVQPKRTDCCKILFEKVQEKMKHVSCFQSYEWDWSTNTSTAFYEISSRLENTQDGSQKERKIETHFW